MPVAGERTSFCFHLCILICICIESLGRGGQGGSSGRYASSGSGRNQFLEQHGFTRKWKHGGSGPSEGHTVRQLLLLYRGEDACHQSSDSLEQR